MPTPPQSIINGLLQFMKEGLPFFLTLGGHTVEIGLRGEQFCLIVHKILIGVLVCNQVDRILQNKLDGKPGERTPVFVLMPSRPSSSIRLEKSLMLRLMRSRR